jgi:addiction module HigA family antidote
MGNVHNPAHPGEILREYLPEGVSIGEVAKRLGVTRPAPYALLNGRSGVSAPLALRLEGALGTSAEMWLNMQASHDLWRARKRPSRVKRLPESKKAAGERPPQCHIRIRTVPDSPAPTPKSSSALTHGRA